MPDASASFALSLKQEIELESWSLLFRQRE
jgi:hypothetical protein